MISNNYLLPTDMEITVDGFCKMNHGSKFVRVRKTPLVEGAGIVLFSFF